MFRVENGRKLEELMGDGAQPTFDLLDAGRFVYLEPVLRAPQIFPVMSVRCNFRLALPEVRLELGLFLVNAGGEVGAIGCRFETPEGTTGRHRYHHAQLFSAFHKQEAYRLPLCPRWYPDENPAFLLRAEDPVTLLMNLVVSLYGYEYLDTLNAGIGKILKPYMIKIGAS